MRAMSKHRFGHIEIPLQRVHIELTNVCDFNCCFCPKSEMKRPFGFMETDLAKGVITEIGSNHICEKITLHIMGEPTIHPDFFEILETVGGLAVVWADTSWTTTSIR
jgi:molybdenum cofactor biosynthesis enzyme MoaA